MIDITMTFRLFLLPNFAANQSVTVMEIITFESKAYIGSLSSLAASRTISIMRFLTSGEHFS